MNDAPSRYELDREAFEEKTRKSCRRHLRESNPWYHRADELEDRYNAQRGKHGTFLAKLMTRINHEMHDQIDSIFEEEAYEVQDAALLENDPHKYYGVSRRDFL
jgi:hypothetical protein